MRSLSAWLRVPANSFAGAFLDILEAQLNVIEAGFDQRVQTRARPSRLRR